jgi:hypothetical protein
MGKLLNPNKIFLGILLLVIPAVTGCGGVKGVYADQTGMITLDIESGDAATLTFAGDGHACTYKKDGKKLMLECKGLAAPNAAPDKLTLTLHDDDSLTSAELPVALRKRK